MSTERCGGATCKFIRGGGFMGTLGQDVRYAFRMLAKSPMLTAIVVLTLARGIGANTAIFGMGHGLAVRPLPVKSPEQVMTPGARIDGDPPGVFTLSYPQFTDLQKQADVFSDVIASRVDLAGLSVDGKANQFLYAYVSGNYFSGFGLQPALGRLFLPTEGAAGGNEIGR